MKKKINKICLFILIVVCLISEIIIYKQWSKAPRTLKWDNAGHAIPAVEIAQDIIKFDIKSFIKDTNKQNFYPFVHSYIEGAFFVLFGINDKTVVLCGFMLFLLSLIVSYGVCLIINEKNGWLVGLLTCFIMLFVPLNLTYSTQVMLEMLCLMIGLSCIYFYIKSFNNENKLFSLYTGISLSILFFTKYNYGTIFIAVFLLWELINYRNINLTKLKILILPVAISMVLWFSVDTYTKLRVFLSYAFTRTSGYNTFSFENIFLYPKLILRDFLPFPVLFWFFIAMFLVALINIKRMNYKLKFILFVFSIVFITITVHPLKDSRFMIPIFPLFIMIGLSNITDTSLGKIFRMEILSKILSVLIVIFVSGVLMLKAGYIYRDMLNYMFSVYYGDNDTKQIIEYTTDEIIKEGMKNIIFVGTFNELSHHVFKWSLYTKGSILAKEVSEEEIKYPEKYNKAGLNSEFNKDYQAIFNNWLGESKYNYIITIELYDENSKYVNEDYLKYCKWKQNYVELLKLQNKYKLIEEHKFENKMIKIRVYKKEFEPVI